MLVTQNDILKYLNKEYNSENEQLEEFFSLIGTIFSNIQPAVPNIKLSVENVLQSNPSLSFNDGFLLFTKCLDFGKVFLAPLHAPPPLPFILTPPPNPASTNLEVATHIASLLQAWVATGLTPAATLTTPLILI